MRVALWMLLIAIATRSVLCDVFTLRRAIATSPLRDLCVCFVVGAKISMVGVGATSANIADGPLISW